MSDNGEHFPEAPYEDGGAVNFAIVYTIVILACIAAVLIAG
ncbi:MAG: hypothetical protein ACPGEG_08455 [Salibacteraceae bacterium]